MLYVSWHSCHFYSLLNYATWRRQFSIGKESIQRGRNMGVRERNTRLDLQCPGLHTAPSSGKINKILGRIQNIKKFTTKKPRKVMGKLAGNLRQASFRIPGWAGIFSPIQVALKDTRQWLRITPNLTQCLNY